MESLISHVLSFLPGNNFKIRLVQFSLFFSSSNRKREHSSKLWINAFFKLSSRKLSILQTGPANYHPDSPVFPKERNTFRASNVGRESEPLLSVKDAGDL